MTFFWKKCYDIGVKDWMFSFSFEKCCLNNQLAFVCDDLQTIYVGHLKLVVAKLFT